MTERRRLKHLYSSLSAITILSTIDVVLMPMRRRRFLQSFSASSLLAVAGCNTLDREATTPTDQPAPTDTPRGESVRTDTVGRRKWLSGSHLGTRVTRDGALVLDDRRVLADDFSWSSKEESTVPWSVNDPGDSRIVPHPDRGVLELNTTSSNQILELVQDDQFLDFTEHPDWRLNVVESNAQSSVGGAWEFWFTDPDNREHPWLLIDAGGGRGVPNAEANDDSCGDGFYVRRDQVLTKHLTDDGPERCWDEFDDAPIDHSEPRLLTLERLGSKGRVDAYVDDRFQADLSVSDGQYLMDGSKIGAVIRLHDRGDHQETGYVHYLDVQRVGDKVDHGTFLTEISADRRVRWTEARLDYVAPTDTSVETAFSSPLSSSWYSDPTSIPPTETLRMRISMRTADRTRSPRIDDFRVQGRKRPEPTPTTSDDSR